MVAFRDVRLYQCSTCDMWFQESEATLFLSLLASNGTSQNVAVFCSAACKRRFSSKLFPKINRTSKTSKDHAC